MTDASLSCAYTAQPDFSAALTRALTGSAQRETENSAAKALSATAHLEIMTFQALLKRNCTFALAQAGGNSVDRCDEEMTRALASFFIGAQFKMHQLSAGGLPTLLLPAGVSAHVLLSGRLLAVSADDLSNRELRLELRKANFCGVSIQITGQVDAVKDLEMWVWRLASLIDHEYSDEWMQFREVCGLP